MQTGVGVGVDRGRALCVGERRGEDAFSVAPRLNPRQLFNGLMPSL